MIMNNFPSTEDFYPDDLYDFDEPDMDESKFYKFMEALCWDQLSPDQQLIAKEQMKNWADDSEGCSLLEFLEIDPPLDDHQSQAINAIEYMEKMKYDNILIRREIDLLRRLRSVLNDIRFIEPRPR